MPIANCKRCQRIFNKTRRDICPDCIAEEDAAFVAVRAYLREHKDATMAQVTEDTEVEIGIIISLIQDGRLILRDNPNLTYPCARCGAPTQAGRYCADCAKELTHELSVARTRLQKDGQGDAKRIGFYSKP
ncbi:TIGR03826 family flagellar region protein [Alicyclobacillus mengziensis]|uniref:Flagellar protein n=1 Tax=Alicyclobacillus mengziensis TaxID=2931921 RepID=A0A9X7Z784_9BACL|nr:TIGR03826 family flagellar region protein [Alicyclobacillus mengziensis]QSO48137.1 hypothetical protein JZ786_03770 [Alicyclobacillus mengziensis]